MRQQDYEEYYDADGAPPDDAAFFRAATTSEDSPSRTLIYTPRARFRCSEAEWAV
jgi:hypothetical protein